MHIDQPTLDQLAATFTIDITTIGRRSGRPSRIEIWWLHMDGRFFITGTSGPRHWLANLRSDPTIVVHALGRDFPGVATVVDAAELRRMVFGAPKASWYTSAESLESLVANAPMVEVHLDGLAGP
jgi:hypothetical protein